MLYTVKNGNTEAVFSTYGATLVSLKFNGKETVIGFKDEADYAKIDGSFGASVGRVANRIAKGEFTLDGVKYTLYKNNGNNTLHGGKYGFSKKEWKAEVKGSEVVFTYFSPDGEENFPGNLIVKVTYTVLCDGVRIDYEATADKNTPINLTNHSYFNLTSGEESAEEHYLTLNSSAITEIDGELIPTGKILKVDGTPFDFRVKKKVGRDINADDAQLKYAGGYDHNFVLDGEGYRKFAEVYSERSNITMDCYTDMPGVQIYSGNFMDEIEIRSGKKVRRRYGLCLETQYFPNSVNIPSFPSAILKAGEKYVSRTEYRFR